MGTVTNFPAREPHEFLPPEVLAEFESEIRRIGTDEALSALTTIPSLVKITLRREFGAQMWDITIESLYFQARTPDAQGHREQLKRYIWEAEQCRLGDDDRGEDPFADRPMSRVGQLFETAGEALTDAESRLARFGRVA